MSYRRVPYCGVQVYFSILMRSLARRLCHIRSDESNEFAVVHNGILTNFKDLRQFLTKKGFTFESDTDTEVIPKLLKHFFDVYSKKGKSLSFRELVELAFAQIEGS